MRYTMKFPYCICDFQKIITKGYFLCVLREYGGKNNLQTVQYLETGDVGLFEKMTLKN